MNSTYKFTLKEEAKVMMKFFFGTKSGRKNLERIKQKVNIFIGTKNIFKQKKFNIYINRVDIFNFLSFKIITRSLDWSWPDPEK